MKTKFIKSFLIALIAAMLPQLASAYYDFEYDGLFYKINDDGISVTVTLEGEICGKSVTKTASSRYYDSGELIIPETVNPYYDDVTYLVTSIDDAVFSGWTGLTSVTLPNSLTSIGGGAFSGCTGLTSIEIPNSVSEIGEYAFQNCSGLTSVTIGNSVTSIGDNAFQDCTSLTSVTWNAKNCSDFTNYDFAPFNRDYDITSFVFGNEVEHIPAYLCCYCIFGLTSVTIPNSVKSIGCYAFSDCGTLTNVNISDLAAWCNIDFEGAGANPLCNANYLYLNGSKVTDLVIPNSITAIKNYAFINCTGLTSVTIPNSVTTIGESTFSGCTGLNSVTIPNSVTSIGGSAFFGCSGLNSVTIPNSVTSIGEYAFHNTAWYNNQPDGLVYAGMVAYKYIGTMPEGTSIILKDGCTMIHNGCFSNCTGLTSVTIPNSVTSIGNHAFSGCSGLTSMVVESGNTKYDSRNNCNAIIETETNTLISGCTNTIIPNSVTSIGSSAFYGCSGLTEVTIPNSVTSIGGSAFSGCSGLTSVNIGNSVTSIGNSAFYNCTGLIAVTWNAKNFSNFSYSEAPFNGLTGITSFVFGNEVEHIPAYLCAGLTGLTSVTIPNSVTSIGGWAFRGCNGLTSVTIPNSVTTIGNSAFYGCSGLTEVNINDLAAWCNIDFNGYDANPLYYAHNLYLNGSRVSNLVIPNSVTKIKQYAFYNCTGLTSVTIGNSVTSIGNHAFSGCSGLTSVNIGNSVTSIGSSAFYGCSGLTEVTIPNSVTSIGGSAFSGCSGLTSVNINDLAAWCNITFNDINANPLYYAHNLYLNGSRVSNLVIPNSVTKIKQYAFYNCSGLISVTIPNSVTSIGEYAFHNTAWYDNLPDGLVYAGMVAYKYKGTMPEGTTIILKNGCTSITSGCFSDCSGLTSVTIPNSVTSIGNWAFYECYGLTSFYSKIKNPQNVNYGYDIFCDWIHYLYVPKGKHDIYSAIYPWGLGYDDDDYPYFSYFYEIIEMPPTGDVNDDGTVNVGDYVATASYILEQDPQPFYFEEGDLDCNNEINVGDLVGVTYIALHYGDEPKLAPAVDTKETPSLAMAADIMGKNGNYEVTINLSNDVDITALQMDLNLPAGMTLVDASLSDRASASHQVAFNQLSNGDYRLLASSSTCKSFNGNDGEVLTLTLAGEPSGNGIIKNIELATPRAASYKVDNIELNFTSPTGIEDMTAATTRIYSEGGNIVIISPNDDTAQIVLPNGMNKTVKVAVGHNVYEAPAKGIVIVKMGNEVKKLRF